MLGPVYIQSNEAKLLNRLKTFGGGCLSSELENWIQPFWVWSSMSNEGGMQNLLQRFRKILFQMSLQEIPAVAEHIKRELQPIWWQIQNISNIKVIRLQMQMFQMCSKSQNYQQRHNVPGQYVSWDDMSRDKMSPDLKWRPCSLYIKHL